MVASYQDLDGALADYNWAITLDSKYAIAYNDRGTVKEEKGDLDGALADYSEAIQLNPQYWLAYKIYGLAISWQQIARQTMTVHRT